ncbi:hypothetical protein PBY51_006862 [Eleginops maclovinus]|uniref:Uncharacterized protein n=1 Tax=Eleginops maclovinus TaxID=56733 RepID=A0AAN7X0B3_ELEMC|nr:hypothetical protein PBY51_006862 [Eleginops maclovinus]
MAEEARRKKQLLLAKMREIDRQELGTQDAMFAEPIPSESNKATSNHASPRLPEQRNSSISNLTEPEESAGFRAGGGDSGRKDQARRGELPQQEWEGEHCGLKSPGTTWHSGAMRLHSGIQLLEVLPATLPVHRNRTGTQR